MRRLVAVLAVAACGGPAPHGAPPTNAVAPRDFGRADLVAVTGDAAILYAAGARVEEVGRVAIDSRLGEPDQADWASRDEFFERVDLRAVVRVTADGVFPVAIPAPSAFELPEPDNNAEPLGWEELVVDDDGAWWGACPWGWNDDQGFCDSWVWIRLAPSAGKREVGDEREGRDWTWPTDAPPELEVAPSDDDEHPASLTCGDVTIAPTGSDERIGEYHWVSVEPPLLLVSFGGYGDDLFGTSHWDLRAGCSPTVLATGDFMAPGPGGLWLGDRTVYRDGTPLGEIAEGLVRFRPPT